MSESSSSAPCIWVVDDDRAVRFVLCTALREAGYQVVDFDSAAPALQALAESPPPALLFTDVRMPGDDGLVLLDKLKAALPQLPVVVMSAYTDVASTAGAFRGGAHEFLSKPFDLDDAVALAQRVLPAVAPALAAPTPAAEAASDQPPQLVGDTPPMRALFRAIGRLAQAPLAVLIIGETGTGKELVARHIHNLSHRRHRPFVAVNCGAFSESLVEAELFGHEKGAFTGALSAKAGWFEEADGGTLFLDEIGDLPMAIQVKLLRVLQEREVVRLGSRKSIPIDVRVLAATNVQLEKAINAGNFREDLFYRLNVVNLELSPLRDRPGDILPLTRHFIEAYSQRLGYGRVGISSGAEQKLRSYSWPGNIRELENVIHHTLLICRNGVIERDDLRLSNLRIERPDDQQSNADDSPEALLERAFQKLFEQQAGALHEKVEDALLRAAYRFCHYNQVHTAALLGLSRNVTRTRLIKIGELAVNKRRLTENLHGERLIQLSI